MIPFEHVNFPRLTRVHKDLDTALSFQTLLVVQAPTNADDALENCPLNESVFRDFDANGKLDDFNTYPLMLLFSPSKRDLLLQISYDETVLAPVQVERLMGQFDRVLKQLCCGPLPPIVKDIDCVGQKDLDQIWSWNQTVPDSVDSLVHDLISAQAKQRPHAAAICAWDGDLTYEALDQCSSVIAGSLNAVYAGNLVPLCFEKSMWAPVAMLAVVKSGRAFVAMDVSMPEVRLKAIVSQTQTNLILCSKGSQNLAARLAPRTIIVSEDTARAREENHFTCMNGHAEPNQSESTHGQRPRFTNTDAPIPSSAFYIGFTSGSTGTPKGVIVRHKNFCSGAKYIAQAIGFHAGARIFDFPSYSFDVSISNFVYALTTGACLCVPLETERRGNLGRAITSMKATQVFLTPSVASSLETSSVPTLETLLLGGEAITPSVVEQWVEKVRVICGYSPSECVSMTNMTDYVKGMKATNIGPGVGATTWIINEHGGLAPIGSIGELLIEGPQVSEGYLGESALTASAFVSDPQWLVDGGLTSGYGRHGRLCKTGDLVQNELDGSIVYLGRKETPIKLRGQRLELGDIEYHVKQALRKNGSALAGAECEVVADIVRRGQSRLLVAYVHQIAGSQGSFKSRSPDLMAQDVSAISHALVDSIGNLKSTLRSYLPDYMIPSAYVSLNFLPTTASRKIDRKRLQTIFSSLSERQILHAGDSMGMIEKWEPSTTMEFRIRRLWASILDGLYSSMKEPRLFI